MRLYDTFGIEVLFSRIRPKGLRCLRSSAQLYNSPDEYRFLADALEQR